MANTLTNLIPLVYESLDVVSREPTGLVGAVNLDPTGEQVARGTVIHSPATPVNTAYNTATGMTVTAATDQTLATKTLAITNFRSVSFNWEAEEIFSLDSGPRHETIIRDQFSQCFRTLTNELEVSLCLAAELGASRAVGTPGTTPVLGDYAAAMKILTDNGAPLTDRHFVIDTTAGVGLRNTANLFKVNESGDSSLLRNGVLGNLYGGDIRESAGISTTILGTGTAYTSNASAFPVGTTAIPVITGSGTILAGDVVTFAGDLNKYVVAVGLAAPGTLTLAAPGLRTAMTAGAKAMTILGTGPSNICLRRNAISLATRLPKSQSGDLASDRFVVTDPQTGIAFELAMWPGQRMVKYEVSIAYGFSVIKPEHLAIIMG